MKPVSRLALTAVLATAAGAWAQCKDVTLAAPADDAVSLGVPAAHLENTYDAYKRIAKAAGFQPPLRICNAVQPNAQALDANGKQVIAVTTGLVRLMNGSSDEIAAVIGHEFGHLKHRHALRKYDNFQDSVAVAVQQAQRKLRRGETLDNAVGSAKVSVLTRVTAFSRAAEREADDEGFALTQAAGFDPGASQRAFAKLRALMGSGDQNGWFATHPGLNERAEYSSRLAMNETYRQRALQELQAGRPGEAADTVARWRAEMPDSGAAAYYNALNLSRRKAANLGAVTVELEESVGNFDGEGLSAAGQSHQVERSAATLALCVALYQEKRTVETLTCIGRLDDESLADFKKVTGWEGFILTQRRGEPEYGSLYAARSPTTIAITNCPHMAQRDGLKPMKPWRGVRTPASPGAQADGMACSPNFCDCQPIDLEKTYPTIFGEKPPAAATTR